MNYWYEYVFAFLLGVVLCICAGLFFDWLFFIVVRCL